MNMTSWSQKLLESVLNFDRNKKYWSSLFKHKLGIWALTLGFDVTRKGLGDLSMHAMCLRNISITL